jgi:UDP-3-O-[3-hydroxymyristoyl] N-acetylglucosamine deacetylase
MNPIKSHYQTTIDKPVIFVGVGLHSGEVAVLKLKPTTDTRGIIFRRMDVSPKKREIMARWYNVSDTTLSTTLTNDSGVSVATIEHLMAALYGCGIDNVIVEIDGPEIPILDGSAQDFVINIEQAGIRFLQKERSVILVQRHVEIQDGDKYATFSPSLSQKFSADLSFPDTPIGEQSFTFDRNRSDFKAQVASARTFGFAEQIEQLKSIGLVKGGTLNNAILVDKDRIINKEKLRFETEFARHKVLDAMGDLALSGYPIIAEYDSYKSGHDMNHKLLSKLMNDQRNWRLVSYTEYADLVGPDHTANIAIEMEDKVIDKIQRKAG